MAGADRPASVIDGHIVVDVADPPPTAAASAPAAYAPAPTASAPGLAPAPSPGTKTAASVAPPAARAAAPTTRTAATVPAPPAPAPVVPAVKTAASAPTLPTPTQAASAPAPASKPAAPTPAAPAANTSVAETPDAKKRKPGPAPPAQTALMRSPELAGRGPIIAPPAVQPDPPSAVLPPATPGADDRVVAAQPLPRTRLADAASPACFAQPKPRRRRCVARSICSPARPGYRNGSGGLAFILPFAATTGAASFQRNQDVFVVFDERRPVDLSSLRDDPVFNRAEVRMLAGGTLLRLPMPGGLSVEPDAVAERLADHRRPRRRRKSSQSPRSMAMANITLPAEQPTGVVTMADPDSGATLLIGTTRRAGQAVGLPRRSADFIVRATNLGVVVEPLSDALTLKVAATGFVMGAAARWTGDLAVGHRNWRDSRRAVADPPARFPFRRRRPAAARLIGQIDEAAMAPAQARGPKRVAAAVSMLSLGMAAEAQSLLRVATEADPRLAASPRRCSAQRGCGAARRPHRRGRRPERSAPERLRRHRFLACRPPGDARGGVTRRRRRFRNHGAAYLPLSQGNPRPGPAARCRDHDPGR